MGIFGGSSKSKVANTYTTTTNTQQTDQSGNEGLNLSNVGGGVSLSSNESNSTVINSLDAGAIEQGSALGRRAIESANAIGSQSLTLLERVNADSIELLSGLVSGALDNSKTLTRDAIEANSKSVKDAISGFSTLAQQNSASSDDRLQKVVTYAIAGIVAAIVLPRIFGGGGKAVIA